MRIVTVAFLLVLVGLVAGSAMADKNGPVEKPWSNHHGVPTAIVPEVEPNDTCPGQAINCGDVVAPASYATTADDDWYQFYATAGTLVTIGTESYNGSDVDTYLQLYGPDCATVLTYDDDGGPNMFSLISNYTIPADGYYNIKTYTYGHYYTGDYQLFVNCGVPNPPDPNDTCNEGYFIERCTQGSLNGDMTWDNNNYDPGSGGCSSGFAEVGKDVVYMMNLNAGDVVDMTYSTPGFDAAFYIITDCSNPAGSCVVGADSGYDVEYINWTVPAGGTGTYWLVLDHYGTDTGGGPWTLDYTLTCPGLPTGACCIGNDCTITTESDCTGSWQGADTTCQPNPCEPNPTHESTWGQIKAQYR
jgi:hypothetical protein